ncbi:hypothetical protein WH47_08641 [Habropoda laboriosa]|uniref:Uncharacterized protein n=1 Tax=Habropoda laboriosa TaxID=597456 RepID=A0A0L7RH78_9HYME|nr:hypothetical protein WH47_08641 [Habropoda laboriosa]
MKPGCLALTDTTQLRVMATVTTTIKQPEYQPGASINISKILPNFGEHHVEILETTPPENGNDWLHSHAGISLQKIEQQLKNIQTGRAHSHPLSTEGIVGLILILSGVAYIATKKARKMYLREENAPRQEDHLPNNEPDVQTTGQPPDGIRQAQPPLGLIALRST